MQLEEFDIEFLALKMSENPQSMLFARLADLYLVKEQNAEAMKLLEEGIPLFPNYYAAYIVLGKAHLAFKEYSQAHNAFSKALELSPFNQTAAQLLTTVPNKPDESTRTTDASYFAPSSSTTAAASPQTENFTYSPVAEAEPLPVAVEAYTETAQPAFEMPAVEEPVYSQSIAETLTPVAVEPVMEQTYAAPIQSEYQPSDESFPSYDEYFAQNQHRINTESPIRLDDYLNGDIPAMKTAAPVIEEMPQHEFVNDAYVETDSFAAESSSAVKVPDISSEPISEFTQTRDTETHYDPEPVFSSPEQAKLFAEMTGMDLPETSSSSTDLDSLTEKLQSAEKIVPEENYQPKTPVPQEPSDDQAYETDAVTPTLAEIYASQGEYRAAIQAYEILMFSQPAKGGEFQQRIRELQQLQMEKDGLI